MADIHDTDRIYRQPFFKDTALQNELREKGYAVRDLLSSGALNELREETRRLLGRIPFRQRFWKYISVGRIEEAAVREFSNDIIRRTVVPALEPMVDGSIDLIPGVHLVKPPSPSSMLNAHQDSALVDERQYMSVYAWVPLVDTAKRNGALEVLPGSHRLGLYQRSLNVPWELEPYLKELNRQLVTVPVRAGQVIFFDSALIHGSGNNFSLRTRIAVNVFLKPKAAEYLHFYMEDMQHGDEVEVYKVSPHFFISEDISLRPGPDYPLLRREPLQQLGIAQEQVSTLFSTV